METRPYFLFGDLVANLGTPVVCALVARALFSPEWNMLLAMIAGMLVSMIIALILSLLLLSRFFGAMEVMVPTMLGGMLAGMFVAMLETMIPLTLTRAICLALLTGFSVFIVMWLANTRLAGVQE